MSFTAPSDLLDRVAIVREKYTNQNNNEDREELLKTLEVVSDFIRQVKTTNANVPAEDLELILEGAWLYCIEDIASEYKLRHPNNSELYKILCEQFGLTKENQLSHKEKLLRLERFSNFVLKEGNYPINKIDLSIDQFFEANKLPTLKIQEQVVNVTRKALLRALIYVVEASNAIPTEKVIDSHLKNFLQKYKDSKTQSEPGFFSSSEQDNEDRILAAQFLEAMQAIVPPIELEENEDDVDEDGIPRSQRIKMGAVLFILQSISNEYSIGSPTHSRLFRLGCQALGIKDLKDYTDHTKLICLTAFSSFIRDRQTPAELERYARKTFPKEENLLKNIDPWLYQAQLELDTMIQNLMMAQTSNWWCTSILGKFLEELFKPAFYGFGFVIGFGVSESKYAVKPKVALSNVISAGITVCLGSVGGYLGYIAADFIVQNALTRAFAKVFEQLGKLIGLTTGSSIGMTVDLSYGTLRNLCEYFLFLHANTTDPHILNQLDPDTIKCILNLPARVFSDEKKQVIEKRLYTNEELEQDWHHVAAPT